MALAARSGTPVVATNDVRFVSREDFGAHEARVCIHEGHTLTDPGRPREYSREQYLKDGAEMIMPGDHVDMDVQLITPIAIEVGQRFAIREGGRTVGAGAIIAVEE